MLIALCAGAVMDAMAYDYSFSGEEWRDGDYVYLIDSRDVYFCGSDFSSFLPPEHQAKQMHIINAGGTVYNTATARHNAHLLHHCGTGYYKNGTVCTKCPELDGVSGTTAGYTNNGIASCYLPNGSVGSNEMGEWLIDGGNCPY